MDRSDLSIIIVHWNTPDLLAACLRSLVEYEKRMVYEVIVVDNDSTRDTVAVEREFPFEQFRFIRLDKNIGFGRACNHGAGLSKADTLLFLGPDTRLIKEDTLLRTYEIFKGIRDAGTFSCSLLNGDASPQKHYFNFPWAGKTLYEWWWETTNHIPPVYRRRQNRAPELLEEVDMVIAHCLMLSRKAFDDAGGFPEDAFMFGDDIEINMRVQKLGYRNYLYRGEQLIHYSGRAGVLSRYGLKRVHVIQDSIFRFNHRHRGFLYALLVSCLLVLRATVNIAPLGILYINGGFKDHFLNNWMIIWHYLAYQWRPEAIRRIAQS